MAGMKAGLALSLAFLLATVGAVAASTTGTGTPAKGATETTPAQKPVAGKTGPKNTVTVHRCIDAKGLVTLQGDPCPPGSHDTTREMTRPKDPPPGSAPPPPPPIVIEPPREEYVPNREIIPPPPIYRCTNTAGEERFSEQYDPNPRCEPIVLYYPYAGVSTPVGAQAITCRWIEDSCVRLTDWQACARFRTMLKEARSAVLHAFSDTAAYRKSEVERLSQIVNENCQ